MYSVDMACHQHLKEPLTPAIVREIERIEKEQDTQKR